MNAAKRSPTSANPTALINCEAEGVTRFIRSRGDLLNLAPGETPSRALADAIVAAAHGHDTMAELKQAVRAEGTLSRWENRDVHYLLEDGHGLTVAKAGRLAAEITDAVHPEDRTVVHLERRIAAAPALADRRLAEMVAMTPAERETIEKGLRTYRDLLVGDLAKQGHTLHPEILQGLLDAVLGPKGLPAPSVDPNRTQRVLTRIEREAELLRAALAANGVTITPDEASYFTARAHGLPSMANLEHGASLDLDVGEWDPRPIFSLLNCRPDVKAVATPRDLGRIIDLAEHAIDPSRPTVARLTEHLARHPAAGDTELTSLPDDQGVRGLERKLAAVGIVTVGDFARLAEDLHPQGKRQILRLLGRSLPIFTSPDRDASLGHGRISEAAGGEDR